MQFHHNGYVTGDPLIKEAAGVGIDRSEDPVSYTHLTLPTTR